jgi:hypothetical protein
MRFNQTQIRHSGEGRNPVGKHNPRSEQDCGIALLRKNHFIAWIPAYAGMTK